MSATSWQEIYRSYSSDDLAAEIASLREELRAAGNIMAQGSGGKNYQRDTSMLRDRLLGATREQARRSGNGPARVGLVDAGD